MLKFAQLGTLEETLSTVPAFTLLTTSTPTVLISTLHISS
jgi:hypothetical protein